MAILVTGGAGYIGSHTVVELQNAGYDVVVLDNLSNASEKSLERVSKITGKPVKFYKADILDRDALNEVFDKEDIDSCIHFAGLKAVGESVAKPWEYYENNIAGTLTLVDVMRKHNVKNIIFSSSATVYGDPAIICGIINGEKMEKEDVLLAYIEYLISLVKRADETVVIQSDDRILEGFRYEKEVEHFLKTAVDKDLFEVYYQPVFWTKEDRYITLEALSRLKHPCMGMIPPDVFISIAERQGLIAQIGLLQFRRVCRFIKENEYMMKQIKNVKFNLSPSELLKPGHRSAPQTGRQERS